MPPKSSISKLPPALRAELDRLIRDGRYTLDQIVAHLQELGGEVKRTAVGDYKKKMEDTFARYREAQEVAGVWMKPLGEQADSQFGQLLAELFKTLAFRTLADMQGNEAGAEPEQLMLLARSLKDIAGAQKADAEYRDKLRAQWQKEMAERAMAAEAEVAKVAKRAGLTAEAAAEIRQHVLGIVG